MAKIDELHVEVKVGVTPDETFDKVANALGYSRFGKCRDVSILSDSFKCSSCEESFYQGEKKFNYCPQCGDAVVL